MFLTVGSFPSQCLLCFFSTLQILSLFGMSAVWNCSRQSSRWYKAIWTLGIQELKSLVNWLDTPRVRESRPGMIQSLI